MSPVYVENALVNFVKNGVTLVCESECGAFSPEGLYRHSEDHFTARPCGSYFGDPYLKNWTSSFERFLSMIVYDAGFQPEVRVDSPKPSRDSFIYVKWGESAGRKMIFVFFS